MLQRVAPAVVFAIEIFPVEPKSMERVFVLFAKNEAQDNVALLVAKSNVPLVKVYTPVAAVGFNVVVPAANWTIVRAPVWVIEFNNLPADVITWGES